MIEDKYTILAEEIRALFEKKFEKFSVEDLDKVADIIRIENWGSNVRDAGKSYDNLPEDEKTRQIL